MDNKYLGEYRAVNGCHKLWVSEYQDSLSFPPQVSYQCDLCHTTHNFRLGKTYTITTPSQERQFEEYCKKNSIEQDVSIKE